MQYSPFHALHIGAAHVEKGIPCQDMCVSEYNDRYSIAVVSDGHGNRRHFRSERGAQQACKTALEEIREFLNLGEHWTPEERESQIQKLKYQICRSWRIAILKDAMNDPWTPEEIEEQRQLLSDEQFARFQSGETAAFAYGCTLCAVFTAEWGWGALQVGDGCLTVIDADGAYRWPMPESTLNSGQRTASLCANNPMTDFRHVIEYGKPIGLMVYTDGIEKAFPSQGKEIIALLHWIWKNQRFGDKDRFDALTGLLEQISQRNPSGDDVSIAGLIDPNAEDAAPRLSSAASANELRALESQRDELLNTIQYNRHRLEDIRKTAPQSDAEEQILRILSRREADLESITKAIDAKRAELGLPALENQEPQQEAETPEESSAPDARPKTEPQSSDDHTSSRSEDSVPHPRKTQPQQTRRSEPLPYQRKDPFDAFGDLSQLLDDALEEAANFLSFFRKHF